MPRDIERAYFHDALLTLPCEYVERFVVAHEVTGLDLSPRLRAGTGWTGQVSKFPTSPNRENTPQEHACGTVSPKF